MDINFDTYSYVVDSTTTNRNSNVKKNTNTGIYTNEKNQVTISSQAQAQTEFVAKTQKKSDLPKKSTDDGTTFPMFTLLSQYEKYFKVLNEHYSKVNEENKKFANPEKHIRDKYFNKNSSYYVKGLTQMERKICAEAEEGVLHGKAPALNNYDPVIQENFGGCNIFTMKMEWNRDIREDINDAINRAFEENGIMIPKDADLRLTVDPYDFYIHADGVGKELAGKIEDALNKGKNGYLLYYHISYCNPVGFGAEEPSQYVMGDGGKMSVYHLVDKLTGYDIRELENRDGAIYTPDGEDLWKVLTEKYNELAADDRSASIGLGEYYADYMRIAKEGWRRSTDANLSIDYKDGYLYDIDTEYGYGPGQTAWQDRVRNYYKSDYESYRKRREETLLKEETTLTKEEAAWEAALAETERVMGELGKFGKLVSDREGAYSGLIYPDKSRLQEILDRVWRDGLVVPLTNNILSLRGELRVIKSFNQRA